MANLDLSANGVYFIRSPGFAALLAKDDINNKINFRWFYYLFSRYAGPQAVGEVPIYRKRFAGHRLCRLVYQESVLICGLILSVSFFWNPSRLPDYGNLGNCLKSGSRFSRKALRPSWASSIR